MEDLKQLLVLHDDYLNACDKCPNSAAFYESRAGKITDRAILLGEISKDEILDKINRSSTLWHSGYHEYLDNSTKIELSKYKIKQEEAKLKQLSSN